MSLINRLASFSGALLLFGVSTMLSAAEETTSWRDAPWKFSAKGYGWLPEAPAKVKVDQQEVADLPESLDNILDSLDMGAMFELEARKGPLLLFVSPIYYKGKGSEHFRGPGGQKRKITLKEKAWIVDYGVGYELGPWDLGEATVSVAPYVGGFYFHDPLEIDVDPEPPLDLGLDIDKTIEFNTPIAGLLTRWRFNDRWSLRVSGHYGVFNSSEVNETWRATGLLARHFKIKSIDSQVFAGYQYLHLDYEDGPLEIDVDVKGPMLGFGVDF